jgi:hypothetical protein
MRARTALLTVFFTLALAVPALASDNGQGLYGETDDKIVTFVCLGVLCFFVFVVVSMSALQGRLEKRKQERKAAEFKQSIGW